MKATVKFEDGHTEEAQVYSYCPPRSIIFGVKGQLYEYSSRIDHNDVFSHQVVTWYKLIGDSGGGISYERAEGIVEISVDTRVTYKYILGDYEGTVKVKPDATENEIKLAIINDILELAYEKVEEE